MEGVGRNGSVQIQRQQSLREGIHTLKNLKVINNEKENRHPLSFGQVLVSGSPGQMADLDRGQFTLVTDSMWTGTELFQLESGKLLVTVNNFCNREMVLHFSKSEKGLLTKVK